MSHGWRPPLLALSLLAAGCSGAKRQAPTASTTTDAGTSAEATSPSAAGEELDLPRPAGIAALVPRLPASASTGKGVPPKQFSLFAVPEGSPVLAYAALTRDACEGELKRRSIPFTRADDVAGVRAPVRLAGPIHGVGIHSPLPVAQRARSRLDLIDCRLALALDDFAAALAARGIVEVVHLSAYRSKTEGGCTVKYPGEQHCAALAVDVASFAKKDGSKLVVDRDFHGKVGALTCATGAPPPNELWDIACSAAGKQFQVVLTPNWNAEHHNHLHLELTVHEWVLAR